MCCGVRRVHIFLTRFWYDFRFRPSQTSLRPQEMSSNNKMAKRPLPPLPLWPKALFPSPMSAPSEAAEPEYISILQRFHNYERDKRDSLENRTSSAERNNNLDTAPVRDAPETNWDTFEDRFVVGQDSESPLSNFDYQTTSSPDSSNFNIHDKKMKEEEEEEEEFGAGFWGNEPTTPTATSSCAREATYVSGGWQRKVKDQRPFRTTYSKSLAPSQSSWADDRDSQSRSTSRWQLYDNFKTVDDEDAMAMAIAASLETFQEDPALPVVLAETVIQGFNPVPQPTDIYSPNSEIEPSNEAKLRELLKTASCKAELESFYVQRKVELAYSSRMKPGERPNLDLKYAPYFMILYFLLTSIANFHPVLDT